MGQKGLTIPRRSWLTKIRRRLGLPYTAGERASAEAYRRQIIPKMNLKSLTTGEALSPSLIGRPFPHDVTIKQYIQDTYKSAHWVFVGLDRIRSAFASIPWCAELRNPSGQWVRDWDHPLTRLVANPNPNCNGQDFAERIVLHMYLGGNFCSSKVRVGGKKAPPSELHVLNIDGVYPVPSRDDFISWYRYWLTGVDKRIEREDMLHFMFTDPDMDKVFWGMSPIQAMKRLVDTDSDAVDWQRNSMRNRAVTSGVFSVEQTLTDEQYDLLFELLEEQHMGPDNADMPWLLGSGAKWQPMDRSPVEMDYVSSRKMYAVEQLAVLGVPPPVAGLYDNATYNNVQTARRIFWEDTIIPFAENIKAAYNHQLTPDFGDPYSIRLTYDVSNIGVLKERFNEKIETGVKAFSIGFTRNEINDRLELGFEPSPEGDTRWVSTAYIPSFDMLTGDVDGVTQAIGEVDEAAKLVGQGALPPADLEEKMARIGNVKDLFLPPRKRINRVEYWKAFDRDRLKAEALWRPRIAKVFKAEYEELRDAIDIRAGGGSSIPSDLGEGRWKKSLTELWEDVVDAFGTRTFARLTGKKDDEWNPTDDAIQEAIDDFVGLKIVGIRAHTVMAVKRVISDSIDDGDGIEGVAKKLQALYADFAGRRAFVIARTEVIGASNYGSRSAAMQLGMERKGWITSKDERVREEHEVMEGEERPIDEPYSNGLQFPGDPKGKAKEVIQCRCVEQYM